MKPGKKVGAGALAGALSVIAVWAAREFAAVDMPPEIASAITVVFTFAVSWFVPETNGREQTT